MNKLDHNVPVYYMNAEYARDHSEIDAFRASERENRNCRRVIENAIRENFDGMHLNQKALDVVLECYSVERIAMVLANTIRIKYDDGRFSRPNKQWARGINMPFYPYYGEPTYDRRYDYEVGSHPAILDGYVTMFRKVYVKEYLWEKFNLSEHSITFHIVDVGDDTLYYRPGIITTQDDFESSEIWYDLATVYGDEPRVTIYSVTSWMIGEGEADYADWDDCEVLEEMDKYNHDAMELFLDEYADGMGTIGDFTLDNPEYEADDEGSDDDE